ncbi:GxxExxY protein [Desulfonatronovibrio hydrogenovorans]|uniref:GxxExxY protein n=1 Tax=Desulfonatronovibrio hydrogenovorans TaxID=53245 RepID=UPI000559133A|nr:GxxExxY protein [Desulfonatronovibrio hydrogenovorans]
MLYEELSYTIQGACFEVYRTMGCGFLESVYQECLEIEFSDRGIPFDSQKELDLEYKGKRLKQRYMPDFVCYGKIIIELKAVDKIASEHKAQVLNYLHATGMRLGLLVNFGHHPKLEWKRMII